MLRLNPGITIDERYKIISVLGEGGMGCVYAAEDLQLERVVALKVLNSAGIPDAQERFKREALALSKITHNNIVRVYAFGDWEQSCPYLVMELLKGKVLAQKIAEEGPFSLKNALSIGKQVSEALTVAHTHGIIHRDIKPSNILITDDGTIKLIDFGLCKFATATKKSGSQVLTQEGWTVGSLHYMSPQLCRAEPADAGSDIYALGIVIYELLTGKPPFDSNDPMALMVKQITQPVPPLTDTLPTLPNASRLDALLKGCLAKENETRYSSAAELSAEIDCIMAKVPEQFDSCPTRSARTKPNSQMHSYMAGLVALLTLLTITAFGYAPALQRLKHSSGQTLITSNLSVDSALQQVSFLTLSAYGMVDSGHPYDRSAYTLFITQANWLIGYVQAKLQHNPDEFQQAYLCWQIAKLKHAEEKNEEAREFYLKAVPLLKQQSLVNSLYRKEYRLFIEDTTHFFGRRFADSNFSGFFTGAQNPYLKGPARDLIVFLFARARLDLEDGNYKQALENLDQASIVSGNASLKDATIMSELTKLQTQVHEATKESKGK
jgi:serine/threonine protein kinase